MSSNEANEKYKRFQESILKDLKELNMLSISEMYKENKDVFKNGIDNEIDFFNVFIKQDAKKYEFDVLDLLEKYYECRIKLFFDDRYRKSNHAVDEV